MPQKKANDIRRKADHDAQKIMDDAVSKQRRSWPCSGYREKAIDIEKRLEQKEEKLDQKLDELVKRQKSSISQKNLCSREELSVKRNQRLRKNSEVAKPLQKTPCETSPTNRRTIWIRFYQRHIEIKTELRNQKKKYAEKFSSTLCNSMLVLWQLRQHRQPSSSRVMISRDESSVKKVEISPHLKKKLVFLSSSMIP